MFLMASHLSRRTERRDYCFEALGLPCQSTPEVIMSEPGVYTKNPECLCNRALLGLTGDGGATLKRSRDVLSSRVAQSRPRQRRRSELPAKWPICLRRWHSRAMCTLLRTVQARTCVASSSCAAAPESFLILAKRQVPSEQGRTRMLRPQGRASQMAAAR